VIKLWQKSKQCSEEVFNAGKEIEAIKHLMLLRIASSLLVPSFACKGELAREKYCYVFLHRTDMNYYTVGQKKKYPLQ
jgi:hypothetical protein